MSQPKQQPKYQVTVLGGGTGSFTVLTGLKKHDSLDLTAIVAMTDDGGSTGILRDQLGILPVGDLRQCLVALSDVPNLWRELFNARFEEGDGLKGHNLGNLILAKLKDLEGGSYQRALANAEKLLHVRGRVLPVTFDNVRLVAETTDGKELYGEHLIDARDAPLKRVFFDPKKPKTNPKALEVIADSHVVILAPGDIYTSLLPTILMPGVREALAETRAPVVYVCNLMAQKNHTEDFSVVDFVDLLHKQAGQEFLDIVVYNTQQPPSRVLQKYTREGKPVSFSSEDFGSRRQHFQGHELLCQELSKPVTGDQLERTFIRHDPDKLAHVLYKLIQGNRAYRKKH